MKIALCLSGHMREYWKVFPSLEKFFLSKYPNTDIFIHTWDLQDLGSESNYINTGMVKKIYKPKSIVIEKYHELYMSPLIISKNYDKNRTALNVVSMYYKIMKANLLKYKYERENYFVYDCVVRFRPDIELKSEFNIEQHLLNHVNIPNLWDFGGINDQCAYSNSANMDIYSSIYKYIERYLNAPTIYLNPEVLLKYHLIKRRLPIKRFDLSYDLRCKWDCFRTYESIEEIFEMSENLKQVKY